MRRPRLFAAFTAAAFAAVLALAAAPGEAHAHSGQLSPTDGCHKHKAAGERHWHVDGTATRGGACVERDGIAYRVQEIEAPAPSAACQGKLAWLVDGNAKYGSSVRIRVSDLNEVADLCLGRPARE